MKDYENVSRYQLPKKSFILARIDGKAFHTYTQGLDKPFDDGLITDMNMTAMELCKEIQNAKFAYVQSDEISILLHESEQDTDPWFGNTLQKMVSVSASIATAKFNQLRAHRAMFDLRCKNEAETASNMMAAVRKMPLAHFDARFWVIPTVNEVVNYFMWRQQDATKNSIASVAQSNFSHRELHNKNGNDMQEMLFTQKGINWNDFEPGKKRGRFIEKVTYEVENTNPYKKTSNIDVAESSLRTKWDVVECPIFSKDREFLLERIKVNY